MNFRNILVSIIWISSVFIGILSVNAYPQKRFHLDFVNYQINGINSNRISDRDILFFHDHFSNSIRRQCNERFLTYPESINVILMTDASAFRKNTNLPYHFSALFNERDVRFVFQNISILKQKKILASVIDHEICHYILYRLRKEILSSDNIVVLNTDSQWLDESWCEYKYPTTNHVTVRFPKTYAELKIHLKKSLMSGKRNERSVAYSLAARFGQKLIEWFGERDALKFVLERNMEESVKNRYDAWSTTQFK